MFGNRNQKDNSQKSINLSEEPPKKEKRGLCLLDKLIVTICISTVGFIGITFINCNFMIPGSINSANSLGGLKNPPPLECKESEKRGYETLLTLLTTAIALKTRLED